MQDEPRKNGDRNGVNNDVISQRLDKWLWHARFVRTRVDAAELVKAGHVRVNGARMIAPSHPVRLNDVLTIALHARVRVVRVAGFSGRRGDSHTAAGLFDEMILPPPVA